jgi:hypothetical protein
VVPLFADEFVAPALAGGGAVTTATLAQGFPNGEHNLELSGPEGVGVEAVRVYCPLP